MARRKTGEENPFKTLSLPEPAAAPTAAPQPATPEGAMRLEDIPGIDARIPPALREAGYGDLWPSQVEAAPIAVAGRNLVLAVPTASGKSLVAYLALLSRALRGGQGLYLVPLRALASEKFEDLKTLGRALGLRVALAIGDLDGEDPQLARYDIVVATSEKADALLRHKANWLTNVQCIVADEVHLLGDPGRGPTLEVLLSRFKSLNKGAQIVALSATIANSRELADWLGAAHVKTEWRPVRLREGILYGKGIQYLDNEKVEVESDLEDASLALAEDSVRKGGSVIVFVSTRKSTEALADKLVQAVKPHLAPEALAKLKEAAESLRGSSDASGAASSRGRGAHEGYETSVEKRLAKCIAGGAAFHHAGLRNRERALVESLFKQGLLRALSATPTLAAGVNLPARRVVVRDLFRYDVNEGNRPIPVLEYKQMAGRAGRPRFDSVGEAITIAKSSEQRSEILLSFLLAEPEKVDSKLGTENALRTHILSSIAAEFVADEQGLDAFLKSTFLAHRSDTWVLKERVTRVIDFLLENDLITSSGDELKATRFGRRVSELYIDPLSAVVIRKALARIGQVKKLTPMSFLHLACATPDMIPIFLRRGDTWLEGEAAEREGELLLPPAAGADYEDFLSQLKTACLLHDWIEEQTEETILNKYGAYPGDVNNKVDTARWLLYATEEIARIFETSATKPAAQVSARLAHGARAELLPLLELRGVGRYRARQLYDAGYASKETLAAASIPDLMRVPGIGPGLAESILRELRDAGVVPAGPAEKVVVERRGQLGLGEFGE
ncbi:MAG TPA: DEAD/DEAH box helicase [Candidatus Thermoplasmatota archaeon]|nr:DEAD/DEAH box helicase [Candidatus Thermoplasmatota archaeon]